MQLLVSSKRFSARVYCPICTHLVDVIVEETPMRYGEKLTPVPGQYCRRCSTSIGSASIVEVLGPAPEGGEVTPEPVPGPRQAKQAPAATVKAATYRRGRERG